MKCPCRYCEKRDVGCHGKCSDYKEWKAESDKLHEIERKERQNYKLGSIANKPRFY